MDHGVVSYRLARSRRAVGLVAFGVFGFAACVEYAAPADDGSSGGRADAADAAPVDTTRDATGDATVPALPCDPAELPIEPALFVSPEGDDAAAGTRAAPFRTLGAALAHVTTPGSVATIVLAEGEYTTDLVIDAPLAGLTVRGGFVHQAASWTRDCSDGARDRTTLRGASRALVATASFGLRSVVLATKTVGLTTAGAPGESLYGAHVSGAGTQVSLTEVLVRVGTAGAGGAAEEPAAASGTTACDGTTACSTGAAGASPSGVGPTPAGTFAELGYVPGNGVVGVAGSAGSPGTIGTTASATCATSCQYDGEFSCFVVAQATVSSTGTCGCGGVGGAGGGQGFGGGAAVGVFAAGPALVTLDHVVVELAGGGNASEGTPGGAGTPGTAGAASSAACSSTCSFDGSPCFMPNDMPQNGGAGGHGGEGGTGAPGGTGAGGHSVGIATFGAASVVEVAVDLARLGVAGTGSPSGTVLPRSEP